MIASRLYRLALLAFPQRHRDSYAPEMIDVFEREFRSRRSNPFTLRPAWFVVAACANALSAGIGERRRQRELRFDPPFSTLDFVLAWRMLVRYPGLSIISLFGIAVAIAIATGAFTIISALTAAQVPFPGGDRLVSLVNRDVSTGNRELRLLRDFDSWRGLTTLDEIGVSRTVKRTLIADGGQPEPVSIAEISASAFRIAGVSALRGRPLLAEDERAGSPDVLVIGQNAWRRRFASDPSIIGRSVQLGSTRYHIVGVMPEGFAFPLNHSYWIPWRIDPSAYEPRTGPSVSVFGRLAPGATLESAQAELATIGRSASTIWAPSHEHLRPRVMPYTSGFNDMDESHNALLLNAIQLVIVLLLVVVCINVAILVYARTASRQGEIAVRGALGASRRRIVGQFFVEALMLAGLAAVLGIAMASVALAQLEGSMLIVAGGALPFWMKFRISPGGALYIVALTLLAAAIIGVVPALKASGRHVHARLQTLSPGSGSRMQMGRVWTTLIVAQVALTVALLPASMFQAWTTLRFRSGDAGFASHQFLTAQLVLDRTVAAPTADGEREFTTRFAAAQRELQRRLESEAPISSVTFSMAAVGEERSVVLEVEGRPAPADPVSDNIVEGSKRGHLVRFNRVATNFFDTFEVPVVMGRGLNESDTGDGASGVLVNRAFVDVHFAGANPLGARIRYVGRSGEAGGRDVVLGRWYEIVGVVPDFPATHTLDVNRVSRIYHAANFGDVIPAELAVRVRTPDATTFAGRFREISAAVDPDLQLRDVVTAESIFKREQGLMRLIGVTVSAVTLSVVVLSAAGIYSLMSFTVVRRRREIGIRAALGADRNRILRGIFARAVGQLAVGAGAGLIGAVGLEQVLEGETFQGEGAIILPIVIVFMAVVGVLAALGPARQGLRIQPTEALREE